MADSCPNYLNVLTCGPLAYLLVFGSLTQFGYPSAGDRPNCELDESCGHVQLLPKVSNKL
jgi:hypothetical protein